MDMLWYDGGPKKEPDFTERARKAANYYCGKYGVAPARILVNPAEMPEGITSVETIVPNWGTVMLRMKVEADRCVLKNHLVMAGANVGRPA